MSSPVDWSGFELLRYVWGTQSFAFRSVSNLELCDGELLDGRENNLKVLGLNPTPVCKPRIKEASTGRVRISRAVVLVGHSATDVFGRCNL